MKNQNAEQNFTEFCAQAGIRWRRVPEEPEKKEPRPDYEIWVSGHKIVVEVKQFDPNPEEKKALEDSGNYPPREPGKRASKAISEANPQLKALSKGKVPAMLVLQGNVSGRRHVDPYDILTAMKGIDRIPITVPEDPNISPSFGEVESGSRRKMTEKHNTTISAVAVIQPSDGMYELYVYHNRFAANPIDPAWLRQPGIHHCKIPEGSPSSLTGWECI